MITTTYGTFYNATGSLSPAAVVADYIAGADADWREQMEKVGAIDSIVEAYTDAIDQALPGDVELVGDEFIGPHHSDDAYDEDAADLDSYREIIDGIDLDGIIKQHEKDIEETLVAAITVVVNARNAAAQQLADSEEAVAEAVRLALKFGLPAVKVAEVLGVSRARVYQIRDGRR